MNQPIKPCPVCGVVPKVHKRDDRFLTVKCCDDKKPHEMIYTQWTEYCINELGFALFERGVHTLAQLTERLSPDPRVVVLDKIGITNEHDLHIVIKAARAQAKKGRKKVDSHHSDVARMCDELIAAQRGEVEG